MVAEDRFTPWLSAAYRTPRLSRFVCRVASELVAKATVGHGSTSRMHSVAGMATNSAIAGQSFAAGLQAHELRVAPARAAPSPARHGVRNAPIRFIPFRVRMAERPWGGRIARHRVSGETSGRKKDETHRQGKGRPQHALTGRLAGRAAIAAEIADAAVVVLAEPQRRGWLPRAGATCEARRAPGRA